jgi:hypothetical protein
MILARWRRARAKPALTHLGPRDPRTWRVVTRLDVTVKGGGPLVIEPPTMLTYEDRTHSRDWWNTRETSATRHESSLPDGRRVEVYESWDEDDEGVMVLTRAFPPPGLEVVPAAARPATSVAR